MKRMNSLLALLLAVLLLLAAFPVAVSAQESPAFLGAPSDLVVLPGGSLTVPLYLYEADAVADLGDGTIAGLQGKLIFDPSLVTLERVEAIPETNFASWTVEYNSSNGVFLLHSSGLADQAKVPAQGDIPFAQAVLRFSDSLTAGQSVEIAMQLTDLCDETGKQLAANATGGSFRVTVPSVTLTPDTVVLDQYDTAVLAVETIPASGVVSWSSSNEEVATVSNGKVTAVAPGSAVITASMTLSGVLCSASCQVTVQAPVLAGIHLAGYYQTTYFIGDPLNTDGLQVYADYTSGASHLVTEGYTVSGFRSDAVGSYSLFVNYQTVSAMYDILVQTPSVALPASMTLYQGAPRPLPQVTTPAGLEVTYTSDDPQVFTVDGTTILAQAPGTAKLTAVLRYREQEFETVCLVTVPDVTVTEVQLISQPDPQQTYYVGTDLSWEDIVLQATFSDGSTQTVQEGFDLIYEADQAGEQQVTVVYGGVDVTFPIVLQQPTLTLSEKMVVLRTEEMTSVALTATSDPEDAQIYWFSSDGAVVTVEDGLVTAVADGTADITAYMTVNGQEYRAVCRVTVGSLLGDLNQDGKLSVTDVVLLRKAILSSSFDPVGDLNEDGVLSVTDVVLLRKAILNQG